MPENKIPSWNDAYNAQAAPGTPEAFQAARERLAAEQKEPGYIPENMKNWVIDGLPKQHPVRQAMKRLDMARQPYDASELYKQYLKGELS